MTWWIPGYEPSEHELAVERLYEKVDSGIRAPFPANRVLIICFTNRSGSTFLAEALASTGSVGPAREYLNHPMIERQSAKHGIESFDAYLLKMAELFSHNNIFTLKAGLRQLYFLAKLEVLGDLLPDPRFVLIERDDVLAQAISWVIAVQTEQWTSAQQGVPREPEYDFGAINSRLDSILSENAAFRSFLARNGCPTKFVRYEQLRSRPAETIRELAESLDFDRTDYVASRVRIEPQQSRLKSEWRSRYLREVGMS